MSSTYWRDRLGHDPAPSGHAVPGSESVTRPVVAVPMTEIAPTREHLSQFATNCLTKPEHRAVGVILLRALVADADGDPNAAAFLEYVLSRCVIVGDGRVGRWRQRGLT